MPGDLTIREARQDEYEAIGELNIRAYAEHAEALGSDGWAWMQSNLRKVAERAAYSEVAVAELDGDLVGGVTYTPANIRPSGAVGLITFVPEDWAYIGIVAVSPAARRSGIGRLLTQTCIDRARRDGARAIGLTTRRIMEPAQRLYRSLGFRRRADLGDPDNGILVFELPLDGER